VDRPVFLHRFDWYQRLHAWTLSHAMGRYEKLVAARKRHLFGPLEGDILEIGPGPGANLPYFRRGIRWYGIEPNRFSRAVLERKAAALGLDALVRDGSAERLPFADGSVDAVVSSLVLCSVGDPSVALAEIRRVLRPGGVFAFIEHVAAPPGSVLRGLQGAVRPCWRLLADGCHPDRDTGAAIAAGFADVQLTPFRVPVPIVAPHVAGVARR
jgi:SAM-dependent methyltransferase